jgi:hypothetical protein
MCRQSSARTNPESMLCTKITCHVSVFFVLRNVSCSVRSLPCRLSLQGLCFGLRQQSPKSANQTAWHTRVSELYACTSRHYVSSRLRKALSERSFWQHFCSTTLPSVPFDSRSRYPVLPFGFFQVFNLPCSDPILTPRSSRAVHRGRVRPSALTQKRTHVSRSLVLRSKL